MKTDLSLYDNRWYHPGRGFLVRGLWFLTNVVFFINPLAASSRLKNALLKWFGATIGKGVVIKPGVNIKYPWHLTLGDFCWIGERVWIDNLTRVSIGSHCCLSQGALLICGNHNYKRSSFDLQIGEITLEEGVWLGAKSVVPGGTVCSSHSVLGVQSVAPSFMEPYTIYRGNPAVAIRQRVISDGA